MPLQPFDEQLLRGILRGRTTEQLSRELHASRDQLYARTLRLAEHLAQHPDRHADGWLPRVAHPALSGLLGVWNRKRHGTPLPSHRDMTLTDLQPWIGNVAISEIMEDGGVPHAQAPEADEPLFKIRVTGRRIIAYHATDYAGYYLNDVAPQQARAHVLGPHRRALVSAAPQYDLRRLPDGREGAVNLHRLVLPFAQDGRVVDIVMTAIYLERDGEEPRDTDGRLFDMMEAAASAGRGPDERHPAEPATPRAARG